MANYLKDELRGFIPEEKSAEIIKAVARGSSILQLSKVDSMSSDRKKFNVLVDGPGAYWVGEGERIKTSGATWIHPVIEAKKLAVIIPTTREKLNDTTIDVFGELKEGIAEAFYQAIDKACLFGEGSPFTTSIFGAVQNAGMLVESGDNLDIAMSDTLAQVEENGYEPNGFAGHVGIKNALRKLRDGNGNLIFDPATKELYSQPIQFVRNGAWDKTKADLITGEWKYSIVGIREGIQYEILKEATLQGTLDTDGKPISLAEQDMIAIKATMRLGYLVVKEDAFAAYKNTAAASNTMGALTVTSVEGSAAGKTAITVTPALTSGNSYKYKTAANPTMPAYGQSCTTGWAAWDGSAEITTTAGHKIVIAEVDAENKAVKAGQATVTVKA